MEEDNHELMLVPQEIPTRDLPEFHRLSERNQIRVRKMMEAFAIIAAAPRVKQGVEQAFCAFGGEKGFSRDRLRCYFYDFKRTNDWRICVNAALDNAAAGAAYPAEFIEYLQKAVDNNGRSVDMALKVIRDAWTTGKHIPGYGTWRQFWNQHHPGAPDPVTCPGYPDGWSTRNLRRKLDTSKYRRKAATIGRFAAKSHRPLVYTTRKDLWLASHYMFDDLEHDFFLNSFAEKQPGRPLELFSHDLFSARKVRWGLRPQTMRDEDKKTNGLTDRMMRMVVAATLFLDGYSPRGTILNAEWGTAKIPDWMEKILVEATRTAPGHSVITVERSGFTGAAAHAGQYPGIRKGNPNFKASLESSNRPVHALTASFPGQTGTNRDLRPEQLKALLVHNDLLLAAFSQLCETSPKTAALLQYDLLELNQGTMLLGEMYEILERMTDHKLEGWKACGNIVQELHLTGRWITQDEMLALPAAEKEMALALLNAGKLKTNPRNMSRLEVWKRDKAELIRLPGYIICQILGDDFAAERKVRSHMFEFEDAEVGPGVHRYHSKVITPEGYTMELKDGEIYKITVNPFAPQFLHVRDAKGRTLGDAEAVLTPSRGDIAGVARAMGAAAKREEELLDPLRIRHLQEAKDRERRARENADLIGGTTKQVSARKRKQTNLQAAAEAALDAVNATHRAEGAVKPKTADTPNHEDIIDDYYTNR